MDTVPSNFIESVAYTVHKLHYFHSSDAKIGDSRWNETIYREIDSRAYHFVHLNQTKGGFKCSFSTGTYTGFRDLRDIKKIERRNFRLKCLAIDHMPSDTESLFFREDDYNGLCRMVPPEQYDDSQLMSTSSSLAHVQNWALRSLMKKVYFTELLLDNSCPVAEEFLKDHIDNHPLLKIVHLFGIKWPSSIQPYVKKFVLQTRIKRKFVLLGNNKVLKLDKLFVQEVIDFWKAHEGFECDIQFPPVGDEHEYLDSMEEIDGECYQLRNKWNTCIKFEKKTIVNIVKVEHPSKERNCVFM